MVENFGSYLKHERELRGVSREEISGTTNIPLRFLKALEENSFDELPGEVFIKGYIRSYANIIGSDFEEMLNIYKEFLEHKNLGSVPTPVPSLMTEPKKLFKLGLVILLVAVLVFGMSFLIKMWDSSEEKKDSLVQKQANIITPKPDINNSDVPVDLITEKNEDVQATAINDTETSELSISESDQLAEGLIKEKVLPPQQSAVRSVQTQSVSRDDMSPQNPEEMVKPLRLTIRAKESSWFNMTIDDLKEEDFILPTGTSKTFWGNVSFRVTVGNKTGVELSLNNKVLTFPASTDRVVKDFIITSELVE